MSAQKNLPSQTNQYNVPTQCWLYNTTPRSNLSQ